jgi:hypothetical protein
VRVYVPTTLALLREYAAVGAVAGYDEPFVAEADDEEAEYDALMAAADASAALAPADARRVVVVAEVAQEGEPIPVARIVAVHADLEGAAPDDDLAWFATQELADLLG